MGLDGHTGACPRFVDGEVAYRLQHVPLGLVAVAPQWAALERPHQCRLREVLGVRVAPRERAGVTEDLGVVLDHDLAQVDEFAVLLLDGVVIEGVVDEVVVGRPHRRLPPDWR